MSDKICSVDGCRKNTTKRGWCDKHYTHWRRHGSPDNYVTERHGLTNSPEYKSWKNMKERCYSINDVNYHRYGGRGIFVCDRWKNSFMNFLEDMGFKPFKKAQIDRKDTDGIYEPSNCRWVSAVENSQNRRSTKANPNLVREIRARAMNGERQYLLCDEFNLSRRVVSDIITGKTWKNIK